MNICNTFSSTMIESVLHNEFISIARIVVAMVIFVRFCIVIPSMNMELDKK